MIEFHPFLLLGDQQLSRIQDAHLSAWQNWVEHWIPAAPVEVSCTCRVVSPSLIHDRAVRWYHAPGWPLDCRVGLDPEKSGCWIAGTLSRSAESADYGYSATAFRLLQRLIDQLVAEIASPADPVPVTPYAARCTPGAWFECRPDEAWLSHASGAVHVQIESSMGAVAILLSPQAVKQMVFPALSQATAQSSLTKRSEALDAAAIFLDIFAKPLNPLTLGDIARLAVGDVMLLDNRIDEPWKVCTGDKNAIAEGILGRREGKRALRIVLDDGH